MHFLSTLLPALLATAVPATAASSHRGAFGLALGDQKLDASCKQVSDYDHLARVREWLSVDDGDGE